MGRSSSPGHSRAPVWVLQIVALAAHRSVPDGGDDDDVAGGHDDDVAGGHEDDDDIGGGHDDDDDDDVAGRHDVDDDVAGGQDDVSVAVLFTCVVDNVES